MTLSLEIASLTPTKHDYDFETADGAVMMMLESLIEFVDEVK
jgi:hypothetical protein